MTPFSIHLPEEILVDLKRRLANTRWPDEITDSGWEYGANLNYLKSLIEYWENQFDWRAQEQKLNQFKHHWQFKHSTKCGKVTVPHPKKSLGIKTIKSVLKQANLTSEQFNRCLK